MTKVVQVNLKGMDVPGPFHSVILVKYADRGVIIFFENNSELFINYDVLQFLSVSDAV